MNRPSSSGEGSSVTAAELQRLRQQWAGPSPAGLCGSSELLLPDAGEVRWFASNIPVLAVEFVPTSSGLVIPAQSAPGSLLRSTMKTYMTSEQILGRPLLPEEIGELVCGISVQDLLSCVGWLMCRLRYNGVSDRETHLALAEQLLVGRSKTLATALINDHSMLLAPQVLLAVTKFGVLLGELDRPTSDQEAVLGDVVAAELGIADWLTAGIDDEDRQWGSYPEKLALEMVANQQFNRSFDDGAALGRHAALWDQLPKRRDPELAAVHEAAFLERTGATLADAFYVGSLLFTHSRAHGQAVFGPDHLQSLNLTPGQTAAVDLYVADVARVRSLLLDEVERVGPVNALRWAAMTMRRFPLARHPSGVITLFDPEFLLQRTCGMAAHWELNHHFNKVGGRRGRRLYGDFKRFRGLVAEDYVGESLNAQAPVVSGTARRLWTEGDLQAEWPDEQSCDFVIDFGTSWVCVEVVSHSLREKPSTASSVDQLDGDLTMMVEDKAAQLHATVERLRTDDSPLTGRPASVGKRLYPVIVATAGFPIGPVTTNVIWDRLAAAGLLQHPLVGPLEVLDLDDLEAIEAVQEAGGPSFADILASKSTGRMSAADMGQFMYFELHLPLKRPSRLESLMRGQFDRLLEQARRGTEEAA